LALVLIASGCSSSSGDDSATTSIAASATTTTTAAETTTTTSAATTTTAASLPNYEELLTADGRFTTLIEVMTIARLKSLLTANGDGTVFLPTDDAFGALPEGLLERLKADPQAESIFADLIFDHALAENKRLTSDELTDLSSIEMFTTRVVSVEVDAEGVIVLDGIATIIDSDLFVSNGTVHVIDAVLIDPDLVGEG